MSVIGKRVIWAGPADGSNQKPLNVEGKALSAVRPGALVEVSASGIDESDNASTVFGQSAVFADKDQMRSKSVDDAWTINENLVAMRLRAGEFANVLVASSVACTIDAAMTSAGDGTLKLAATNGFDEVICYADETVTTTGVQLVRVRGK